MASRSNARIFQFQLQFQFLVFVLLCCFSLSLAEPKSIYEILRAHGLPPGLLPKGVKEFKFDESGRFEVHLDQECNAKFESELHYERNVSGTLSLGQIGGLKGISAQDLFLWFPVKVIRVDVPSSGVIYFDVGVVYKQFSLSLFETPPECEAQGSNPYLRDGDFIAQAVTESLLQRLWYRFGRKLFAGGVLQNVQEKVTELSR